MFLRGCLRRLAIGTKTVDFGYLMCHLKAATIAKAGEIR